MRLQEQATSCEPAEKQMSALESRVKAAVALRDKRLSAVESKGKELKERQEALKAAQDGLDQLSSQLASFDAQCGSVTSSSGMVPLTSGSVWSDLSKLSLEQRQSHCQKVLDGLFEAPSFSLAGMFGKAYKHGPVSVAAEAGKLLQLADAQDQQSTKMQQQDIVSAQLRASIFELRASRDIVPDLDRIARGAEYPVL